MSPCPMPAENQFLLGITPYYQQTPLPGHVCEGGDGQEAQKSVSGDFLQTPLESPKMATG